MNFSDTQGHATEMRLRSEQLLTLTDISWIFGVHLKGPQSEVYSRGRCSQQSQEKREEVASGFLSSHPPHLPLRPPENKGGLVELALQLLQDTDDYIPQGLGRDSSQQEHSRRSRKTGWD